ncbi:nitrate assimilation regulatory protein nirA [Podospora aff. communis PSN243]|uniref:Nitrate assimilation regulatory protein nirA n=1 Tax=Podospora aff. communis PSN243 TaxID=3040156 RepID=A0AAV9GQ78_9PEZI|nr:nitrate assimilation regulatory protein nirA [Podospora aff. communis PSN243]
MEPSKYRPLLPAQKFDAGPSAGGNGGGPPGPTRELAKKRAATSAPCEPCRKHKIKCDGLRPVCRSCSFRSRDCTWSQAPGENKVAVLKRKYTELEEETASLRSSTRNLRSAHETLVGLFEIIRSRDEADAAAVYQRLRQGADPEAVLRSVREGDLLLQLQLIPETRFRYVFPFRKEMPSFLRIRARPYLASLLFDASADATGEPPRPLPSLANEQSRPQFFKPYHAARIDDPRLDEVRPSEWTMVSNDDGLMRTLLRLYYQYEYHFFTCFHMDAFLDDMLSGPRTNRFCSPVLVNAILAHACRCHLGFHDRVEHWNPQSLGYRFFAETKRLFEMEINDENRSITLLQAGNIINILLNMDSMDKLGMTYNIHCVSIAYDLGLYKTPSQPRSKLRQRVYDYTAWNLYWYISVQCLFFHMVPLIRETPKNPLPDPEADPNWYGETRVRYPSSQALVSLNHGHGFKAKAELAIILNSLATRLFECEDESQGPAPASSGLVLEYINRMNGWFDSLPQCLTAAEIVFPSQLKIHLTYHNVMTKICELMIPEELSSEHQEDIQDTLERSRACFEAITRLYYLRHGYEHADSFISHALTVLSFVAISTVTAAQQQEQHDSRESTPSSDTQHEITLDVARSTLILAAKGLSEQARNYYMPYTVLHLVLKNMAPQDLDILYTLANVRRESVGMSQERAKHVQALYPIEVVSMVNHPEKKRMGELIREYAGLALEERESVGASTTSSPAANAE